MRDKIKIGFPDENASAEAKLLWHRAPNTCAAISSLVPYKGTAHHAIYSGSECVLLLDRLLRLDPENATSDVKRGEIGFAWFAAGSYYGVEKEFSEICWFYDIDAEPRMWKSLAPVTIFATISEPADAFYAVCRRMRREGVKPCLFELIE